MVRIVKGKLIKGQKIRIMSTNDDHVVTDLGVFSPKKNSVPNLGKIGPKMAQIVVFGQFLKNCYKDFPDFAYDHRSE